MKISYNEFHVRRDLRDMCKFTKALFTSNGNLILTNMKDIRLFAEKINTLPDSYFTDRQYISAGQLNAMGLIDEIFHYVCMVYRKSVNPLAVSGALSVLDEEFGHQETNRLLTEFNTEFPPIAVYQKKLSVQQYLLQTGKDTGTGLLRDNRESSLEELILLHLANENPAFKPFKVLFTDRKLAENPIYKESWKTIQEYFKTQPVFGPFHHELITLLREPVVFSPDSLKGQLDYIHAHWTMIPWMKQLLTGIDIIAEEEKAAWHPGGGAPEMAPYNYENLIKEYERFSQDREWMPKVVLLAKTVLVWLDQLSKKYSRSITRLDQIPDEELNTLAEEGFTGLWLIGLWERSYASKRIKQLCGNLEATASAYSLNDYEIAADLGGWEALDNLRKRLGQRGIRLAADMVPNHTGIDSRWVIEKPNLFIQRRDCPFPQYTFNGKNLSQDSRISIYIEDHYYSRDDCAVVFKRVDNATGDTRYIYHGNDGTGLPWNDTAQIDFLNPQAREEVIQKILHVAQNFPIIRFDAAMVLAKKHIRRLWYPEPGHGGDIATRSETGLSTQQFEAAIPQEFWREVVDRVAKEVPDTLLLAEAFWMMEGYFVRTLGMHRVYNSAFMNMLKREDNKKYRDTVKNTLSFDPGVLKRFVNFMNNPDEETAVAQFGKGDKYFGVCTLMVTMPGLPMFGHGQIEGFEEKYGMEYTKAYKNEQPDLNLLDRHRHDIFPLMKKRYLFAQVENFLFYDVWNNNKIEENVFAYSNGAGKERAIVFYNNAYSRASGWIKQSVAYAVKNGEGKQNTKMRSQSISEGLGLTGEQDTYCIFREHHRDLWFIRSSADICKQGMFVNLKGFEYQVFMDIRQVTDTTDGKYRILCEKLGGIGVEDLEIAWAEIKYEKLYESLDAFFSQHFVKRIHELQCRPPDRKQSQSIKEISFLLKEIKPHAIAFYRVAAALAGQKAGSEGKNFASFARSMKELIKLQNKVAESKEKQITTVQLNKAALSGNKTNFMQVIREAFPEIVDILPCYAAVSAFVKNDWIEKWFFVHKFTQILQNSGIETNELQKNLSYLFTLATAPHIATAMLKKKTAAHKIASFLVQGPKADMLCGVNTFEGINWFNKEMTDKSIALLCMINLLSATPARTAAVLNLYNILTEAQQKSEYKCTSFICQFDIRKAENTMRKKRPTRINLKKKSPTPTQASGHGVL